MLSRGREITLMIVPIVLIALQGCTGRIAGTPSESISTAGKTILPTITETRSPQPSATKTARPNAAATTDSVETASIGTLVSSVPSAVIAKYPSLDGKWRAEIIRYDCSYVNRTYNEKIAYEQLKLFNLSDGAEKIVTDQRQNCGGVGTFGLQGLYWSSNSRYFYYNAAREGYPDGGCGNYIPLIYRLDVVDQKVITLKGGFISPDKSKLALWQGREIVIWDSNMGEVARAATLDPDLLTGRIWWSDTGNSIVYLQTDSECIPGFGKFYLVSFDLLDLSQHLITKYESSSSGIGSTPAPGGVFVFFFYTPLIMNYDPSIWEIKGGVLQAKDSTSCSIAEQGPTDFNGPHTSEIVQLGDVSYEVLSFPELSQGRINKAYIANQAYTTDAGLPVFWVSAEPKGWDQCKTLAEEVLSTLRFPAK